ncbi:MAG: response regulator transcription factor [Lachnospirales bacterium]
MRILIVEDNIDLNDIIMKKLHTEGYAVDSCFDGEEALEYLETINYDVAIMDIMMPKLNGIETVKKLRQKNNLTPIIFLTAKDSIVDKVNGLDIGANDYLTKPFSFDELMARIRVLTRTISGNPTNIYTLEDLTLNIETHIVTRGDNEISLTALEYTLLEYLLRNKNKILSRQKIEDNVWNYDYEGGTNVVDVYITYLRKKIDEGHKVKLIHTVRGIGYTMKVEQ